MEPNVFFPTCSIEERTGPIIRIDLGGIPTVPTWFKEEIEKLITRARQEYADARLPN